MSGPANIDSWFEFIVWMLVGSSILATAIGTAYNAVKSHRTNQLTHIVRDNVQNGHPTPLREDIDGLASTIDSLTSTTSDIARELRALREDVQQDRVEARAHRRDVNDRIDRMEERRHG
ncbi:DUF2746 domain-containing protein [Gordonia sp. NB41Y]|uniref:DUF2746 domain-containing protein n=1 Tax=Gordonia sp. NB41Y TaxID=875808 RepID=UPI0002BE534C|nr:DUF2746 domain-containing protein [Gordonia sp. NB41Y]EMP12889.1 hypothetical protein ISGA_4052 [Gordonia sp. NB41Y]WLP91309.1 DUF2746 domain-containing protein [Gordonia sp. NB41Y]